MIKKIISCNENDKSFTVTMPKSWGGQKIRIDDGVITDKTVKKCDYAVVAHNEEKQRYALVYVELKGGDLSKALLQLESTIVHLKNDPNYINYAHQYARAVCSKINPAINANLQTQKALFKKRHRFDLAWHSQTGSLPLPQ